jgi:hypothetical protein
MYEMPVTRPNGLQVICEVLPMPVDFENSHDRTGKEEKREEREEGAIQERLKPAKTRGKVRAIRVVRVDEHSDCIASFIFERKSLTSSVPDQEVPDSAACTRPSYSYE